MVRNVTTALVAALVLGSAGIASARAPSIEHYDGWTYPQSEVCPAGPANNHSA